jgi:hypothetical protein
MILNAVVTKEAACPSSTPCTFEISPPFFDV